MSNNQIYYLFPRKVAIILFFIFILVMYPLRYISLFYLDTSYWSFCFNNWDFKVDNTKIEISYILIFVIFLFLFTLLFPKTIVIRVNNMQRQFIYLCSCITVFLSLILLVSGSKMGSNSNLFHKIVSFFMTSLIPRDFIILLVILFTKGMFKKFILLIYISILFLSGSKSGIFLILLMFFVSHIALGKSVLNFKYICLFLTSIAFYPFFLYLGYINRFGVNLSFFDIKEIMLNYNIIETSFLQISRRLSGIDILMIDAIDNNIVFSVESILSYLFKGLSTAYIYDIFISQQSSFGIGRSFAIEFLGQSKDLPNGFEPTLFGLIYFSNEPFIIFILISVVSVITLFVILHFAKNWLGLSYIIFFIFQFTLLILTGTILNLTINIRYILFSLILYSLYKLFIKSKSLDRIV